MIKLGHDFYNRCPIEVARDLLGKKFIFSHYEGIITETEAYRGLDDEASHAFKGPTKRASIMFGPCGQIYVYMIYGMYFCMNIVTGDIGEAGAVLIRGLKVKDKILNGPGKVCRHLGITKIHNGLDLINNDQAYLTEGLTISNPLITPRIGINKAIDKLWRFCISDIKVSQL